MKPMLFSPMLYGKYAAIRMPDGKEYRRVVRYSRTDGLYVIVANRRIRERDIIRKENKDG